MCSSFSGKIDLLTSMFPAACSTDDIVYRFGQISVGLRSYVGSILATNAGSCSAGSGGDFIVFKGNCPESVFVHEAYVILCSLQ